MADSQLCSPAFIYLCFSLTQITVDTVKGEYNKAFFKFFIMIIFTLLLNNLCMRGLGMASWIIVFVPFMLMSTVTDILLYVFGFDPTTGKFKNYNGGNKRQRKLDVREKAELQYQNESEPQPTENSNNIVTQKHKSSTCNLQTNSVKQDYDELNTIDERIEKLLEESKDPLRPVQSNDIVKNSNKEGFSVREGYQGPTFSQKIVPSTLEDSNNIACSAGSTSDYCNVTNTTNNTTNKTYSNKLQPYATPAHNYMQVMQY